MARLLLVAALVVALMGCGDDMAMDRRAATSYDGPLHLPAGEGRHPEAGAAGDVVDCDAWGSGGSFQGEEYDEGATSDDPDEAVRTAFSEGLFLTVPADLAVAAEEDDRVLYIAEVDGRAKAALVVHEGDATQGAGGDGWYAESWAVCDVVELPADFVEELGYEVWTDADGRVVPTSELQVVHGPEHCDWQEMTFLSFGPQDAGPTFVRGAMPDLADYFAEPYRGHVPLPQEAVDTGYRHGDDRLWLLPDRSRAYVGEDPDDVELWPRMVERLGCA